MIPEITNKIEAILAGYRKSGSVDEAIIEQMKALRQDFITIEQPSIVKSIRLSYEYIQAFGSLDGLSYWEEEEIELDEENTSFEYYINLLRNPQNKYNKEEILLMNDLLKEAL